MGIEVIPHNTVSNSADEPDLRDLFLFSVGNRTFGVPAEEVDGTAEAKPPAPLPRAPRCILGVVYARGRMLTLFDPLVLTTGGDPSGEPLHNDTIICLRGDEQLSLAAESIGGTITISSADIEPISNGSESEGSSAIAGILRHGGQEITILDPRRLFTAAVYRKDRRRRRI